MTTVAAADCDVVQVAAPPSALPLVEFGARPAIRIGRGATLRLLDLATAGLMVALVVAAEIPIGAELAVVLGVTWVAVLDLSRAYTPGCPLTRGAGVHPVLRAATRFALLCWVLPLVVPGQADPVALVGLTGALTVATLSTRLATARAPRRPARVVIAGSASEVRRIVDAVGQQWPRRLEIVGTFVPLHEADDLPGATALPDLDEWPDVLRDHAAQAVIATPCEELDPRLLRRLSWSMERIGAQLYVGTGLMDVGAARATLAPIGDLRVLHLTGAPRHGVRAFAKGAAERMCAAAVLLALLPLLLLVVVTVRRDSPGPAIFRQERVGRNGRIFTMLKFRTMRTDVEVALSELAERNDGNGVLFKIRQDPRVTGIGRVLRVYSLDELPQLWNVVKGDMSLVGPRPALPAEVAYYDRDAKRRLAVKPGVTGLWQVSGRSDLTWEESVRLDVHYVDNWSIGLDLGIVWRTVGAVLGHRGAY